MNDNEKLQLKKMISMNNVEDQTGLIRDLKHSHILRSDIDNLIMLKAKYMDDPEQLTLEAMTDCTFLFTYYTDIYNKIKKDEIDLQMLYKFIDILKSVEDGNKDQHEASYEVGSILKKIYVDSALRKSEKLDEDSEKKEPEFKGPQVNISWAEFKRQSKHSKQK